MPGYFGRKINYRPLLFFKAEGFESADRKRTSTTGVSLYVQSLDSLKSRIRYASVVGACLTLFFYSITVLLEREVC